MKGARRASVALALLSLGALPSARCRNATAHGRFLRTRHTGQSMPLSEPLKVKVALWLRADAGVGLDKANGAVVAHWKDVTSPGASGGVARDFEPLEPTRLAMQVRKFREQIERDREASRDSGKPPPPDDAETELDATQGRATLEPTGAPGDMPAIHFGCSLTSRGVQLRTGVSALFAVAPEWLHDGDQIGGQRFFGHYPFGQLRFHDRKVSFKTDSGDHLLEGSRAGELQNGAWVIVSYRFGEHVEMALNGEPMRVATHSGRKTTPSFSSQPLLTVGGTNADCSFMGKLAEVRRRLRPASRASVTLAFAGAGFWSHAKQRRDALSCRVPLDAVGDPPREHRAA